MIDMKYINCNVGILTTSIVIAVLFFPICCAQNGESFDPSFARNNSLEAINPDLSYYENPMHKFSLSYPRDWYAKEQDSNSLGILYGFLPPEEDILNPMDYLIIQVDTLSSNTTLDQYTEGLLSQAKKDSANMEIISAKTSTLGKLPAGVLIYSMKEQNDNFKIMKICAVKENKAYILTYNALSDNFDKYLAAVTDLARSFEFRDLEESKPAFSQNPVSNKTDITTKFNKNQGDFEKSEIDDETAKIPTDELEKNIENLTDENANIRSLAARSLGELNDPRAIEPLIQALHDSDNVVQIEAENALEKIGKPAVSPLIQALEDEDRDFRFEVAGVLGDIGDVAIEPLIQALDDDSPSIRSGAADSLGRIHDERTIDPLIKTLNDTNSSVSFYAASALGKIGVSALEPLIQALEDNNRRVRANAAYALGEIEDKMAVEPLIQALKDKDWTVRGNAADALGKIKDSRAVEPLIIALKDEEWTVRFDTAFALGEIKDKRAIEPLIETLKDDDPIIREYAAKSLGEIGDPIAINALKETTKDEDLEVQYAAEEALEKIESENSGMDGSNDEEDELGMQ